MALPKRSLALLILAAGVATCTDTAPAPVSPTTRVPGTARVSFVPTFSKGAQAAAARMDDFGISFDHVRVVLVRPVNDTVADTTVVFSPGQADLTLDLTVKADANETFNASIDYTNPTGVVFHGTGTVQSYAPDQPAPAQQITVNYTGPGANITRIAVAPKTATVVAPGVQTFTVTAFDANNAPVASPPISWSVSDPTVASISSAGSLTTTGKRGVVTVTALAVTNATDNATVTISLPPATIVLVSGGGQTGKAGATLPLPGVVRVTAIDGAGIGGIPVNFAAPTGGKVGSTSVTTDASGAASTSLTLGGAAGPQSFAAVAQGFSVAIPATATAGDPAAVAFVSGDAQIDTVLHTLKAPFVVKVTDAFGNGLSGVTVNWTRASGSGTLAAASSTSDASGQASMSYTLGTTAGNETVTASIAGAASGVTFTATVLAGKASGIAIVSGDGQNVAISTAAAPFIVKVTDANGNAVNKATVTWTVTNGTISSTTTPTDATGTTQNTMTTGATVGSASATASVGPRTVAFGVTVHAGIVAKAAFAINPPASASAGVSMSPPIQVALQDAGGNPTSATNSVTIAIGSNPSGGTLSGTLTKSAVAGIATFDDLKIDKAGAGYTLVATSAGATNATSTSFAIVAGAASGLAKVAGDGQTATVNTTVATAPSVRLTDASGNPISGVSVTFTPAGGSSVLPSTPVLTDVTGTATLTSWKLGTVAGTQTLTASTVGVSSVSFSASATPGVPTHLAVTALPATQIAGANATVTAQLRDAFENVVPTSGQTINWTSTNGGSFASPSNATDATGSTPAMNFTTSTVASTTHTITATDGLSLTVFGTASVSTIPGPAAKLFLAADATSPVGAGVVFPTQPVLQLEDVNGNLVLSSGISVSATIASGGGTLGGTTTVSTDAGGRATFASLKIDGTVGTRTLSFTSAGLTPATSGSIAVTPGAPAALVFVQNPTSTTAGAAIAPPVTVAIRDIDNNTVTSATNAISLAITAGTGAAGATLGGTTSLAATAGVGTFSTLNITSASATAYSLRATATGLTAATSTVFIISAAAPASIAIVSGDNQVFPSNGGGTRASQVVIVKDAFANPVSGASVTWVAGSGGTVSSGTVATSPVGTAANSTQISAFPSTVTTTATVGALTPVVFTATRASQGNWDTECKIGNTATYCWSDDAYGSLGDGTTNFASRPVAVAGGHTFTTLMDDYASHECGLVASGAAFCWGRNTFGEIGDGTQTDRTTPVAVSGGHTFVAIVGASYATCGLTSGGQIYCWGSVGGGIMGDGDVGTIRTVPTLVNTAGRLYSKITVLDDFMCGVETGGALSCWGQTPTGFSATPATVAGAPTLVSLTSGFYHVCGITAAGQGYCWGSLTSSGQIGDGTTASHTTPFAILTSQTLSSIHAYGYNTCAVTTASNLYCWGDELSGSKIGDGSAAGGIQPTPTLVSSGWSKVFGGGISTTCAEDTFGNPYCWGSSTGSSESPSSTTPVLVDWPEGFAGIGRIRKP